jgi:hypothetical protein
VRKPALYNHTGKYLELLCSEHQIPGRDGTETLADVDLAGVAEELHYFIDGLARQVQAIVRHTARAGELPAGRAGKAIQAAAEGLGVNVAAAQSDLHAIQRLMPTAEQRRAIEMPATDLRAGYLAHFDPHAGRPHRSQRPRTLVKDTWSNGTGGVTVAWVDHDTTTYFGPDFTVVAERLT